jgi:hypothetical protein
VTTRAKWIAIVIVSVVVLGATAVAGTLAWSQYQIRNHAPSSADIATPQTWSTIDRIVFRNTAAGQGYGHVASVPIEDPAGPRALLDVACDRVAATSTSLSCLRSERGITPSYSARLYDSAGAPQREWPLAGIPSRTRFSPDGSLVATTSFVTGHAYASIGFSTRTEIHRVSDGTGLGDLEDWRLIVDGAPSTAVDRNYWGVTFIDDSTFYATAGMATAGKTYLVKGDIATQTLTSVLDSVECPSLSPDGTTIAFKRVTAGSGPTVHWTPAVFDIATGEVTVLKVESRSIDDQIAWLDDDTLMYGLPNDAPGDSDIWTLGADGAQAPHLLIEHAWSPTAVRG